MEMDFAGTTEMQREMKGKSSQFRSCDCNGKKIRFVKYYSRRGLKPWKMKMMTQKEANQQ